MRNTAASDAVNGQEPDSPNLHEGLEGIVLPTDYRINAERALAARPVGASNYLRHTLIGDPELDALMEEMASLPSADLGLFIHAGMEEDEDTLRSVPEALREFFLSPPPDPPWLDREAFRPGIRAFHRDSGMILVGFVT